MLARYHLHGADWQLAKWLILMALASALALVFASSMAGAAEFRPAHVPDTLPSDIDVWSSPIDSHPETATAAADLWRAIELRRSDRIEESMQAWEELSLPADAEVWRKVAVGEAQLMLGKLNEAEESLLLAETLGPQQPLVHYLLGCLRLQQSEVADEWYDAIEPGRTGVLISLRDPATMPQTRGIYQLNAVREFEEVIRLYEEWMSETPLVSADALECDDAGPVVGDLELALGADNLVGRSHHWLGVLLLDLDSTSEAESHLDDAVEEGVDVKSAFSELAKRYTEDGQHAAALRANLKAAQAEPEKLEPLRRAWQNLIDAI